MLLMSAQARALHFCPLPTGQHKHTSHTHRDNFFSTLSSTSKRMSPAALVPTCGCCPFLFHPLCHPLFLERCGSSTSISRRSRMISTGQAHSHCQHSGGKSGRNWPGFQQAQLLCWKDAEAKSHLNSDTWVCGPDLCPCRWVTSVPQFHQLLLCDIVCPAPPEG